MVGNTTQYHNKYSLWISKVPVTYTEDSKGNKEIVHPSADDFMFLGSSSSLPFSMSYSSTTTGILGQTSDTAIFVDGVSGAVMNINVSSQRVNPIVFKGNIHYKIEVPKDPTIGDTYRIAPLSGTSLDLGDNSKYYQYDGTSWVKKTKVAKTRRIVWTGEMWVDSDSYAPLYSNKKFIETLMEMRTSIQMMDNAYVLYIYNVTQTSQSTYEGTLANLEAFRQSNAVPKYVYVFINSFDISLDANAPNEIGVSLSLIQRNVLKGYNE